MNLIDLDAKPPSKVDMGTTRLKANDLLRIHGTIRSAGNGTHLPVYIEITSPRPNGEVRIEGSGIATDTKKNAEGERFVVDLKTPPPRGNRHQFDVQVRAGTTVVAYGRVEIAE